MAEDLSEDSSSTILIKYGGNAMKDPELQDKIVSTLKELHLGGIRFILVHGGGPFIQAILDKYEIPSEFIGGHRKTTTEAFKYIEMALKGEVNSELVSLFRKYGLNAVGLSGKDGGIVKARKRWHHSDENEKVDLGQVGDVAEVDTDFIKLLLGNGYIPVLTCLATDDDGNSFNINSDMFAGHLAGAMEVDKYIIMTDVDGLYRDIDDADSIIHKLNIENINALKGSVIQKGMIPKIESAKIALEGGAGKAQILNGTKPEQLINYFTDNQLIGTEIYKDVN